MSIALRVAPLLLIATVALPAAADTIYLVNGRVIRSEAVRVEGDRVIFRQYGGEISIPRDAVVRIVDDDESERSTAARPTAEAQTDVPTAADAAGPGYGAARSRDASPHPSRQPEYWIKHIREVDERIARAQSELDRLPAYDDVDRRLLRYSGQALYFIAERDKWQAMLRRFRNTRRQLLEGARKAGIPPGALRDGLRR